MLLNRDFNETFKEQMTTDHPELATVFMSHSTLELSAAGEHQLRLDLLKVLADAEKMILIPILQINKPLRLPLKSGLNPILYLPIS